MQTRVKVQCPSCRSHPSFHLYVKIDVHRDGDVDGEGHLVMECATCGCVIHLDAKVPVTQSPAAKLTLGKLSLGLSTRPKAEG